MVPQPPSRRTVEPYRAAKRFSLLSTTEGKHVMKIFSKLAAATALATLAACGGGGAEENTGTTLEANTLVVDNMSTDMNMDMNMGTDMNMDMNMGTDMNMDMNATGNTATNTY